MATGDDDGRLTTSELDRGEVDLAALGREVRGLRDDLHGYRYAVELRLRRRLRWTVTTAVVGFLLVLLVAANGVYLAQLERRLAEQTLAAALATTCAELRELDAILVTFLEARLADADPNAPGAAATEQLIRRLSDDPCPNTPEVRP